jgi:hypothetical protein
MPLSNQWKRHEAIELLSIAYDHDPDDLEELDDFELFTWMEELGWEWDGDSWGRVDAEPEPKPAKPPKPKTRRKTDAERLAAWNNVTRGIG